MKHSTEEHQKARLLCCCAQQPTVSDKCFQKIWKSDVTHIIQNLSCLNTLRRKKSTTEAKLPNKECARKSLTKVDDTSLF